MGSKSFAMRFLVLMLCALFLSGAFPAEGFAVVNEVVTSFSILFNANTQSGNNTSIILLDVTDENAATFYLSKTNASTDIHQFTIKTDDGWYFDNWSTYFSGYIDEFLMSDPAVNAKNPKDDDGNYVFWNVYHNQPFYRREYIIVDPIPDWYGTYVVNAILKPIVTVNADESIHYVLTTGDPTEISENQTAVRHRDNVVITFIVDDGYVLTDVGAGGTKDITIDKTNSKITLNNTEKPTTVNIRARLMQQKVIFDANSGEGSASDQVFEYGISQALNANAFTKEGFVFSHWNTQADGKGKSYADRAQAVFSPSEDQKSVILYAQWTKIKTEDPPAAPDESIPLPPTGDESHTAFWLALALLSAGALVLIYVFRKKKAKDK